MAAQPTRQTILTTPLSECANFIHADDRAYWSKPRIVREMYTDVATRLVWVQEEIYGVFPVVQKNLSRRYI